MSNPERLIVIGGSAGARDAITGILSSIPKDINAAFFVVVHSSFDTPSFFDQVLKKRTDLDVVVAGNGVKITAGTVYIAKPNFHLTIDDNRVYIIKGPRENLFRPAIDVLFRSAAVHHSNRVIGILLTGRLNDGSSGLEAIKKCGGVTIIQDPETAEFRGMPAYAREHVAVDRILGLEDIARAILEIVSTEIPQKINVPLYLKRENEIVNKIGSNIFLENKLGDQVPISCPSCSGPLWKMKDTSINRYRCHVGHSFTEEALLESQNESLEETLWISLRTLEEKRMLLERMHSNYDSKRSGSMVRSYDDKIMEVSKHISKLKQILQLTD